MWLTVGFASREGEHATHQQRGFPRTNVFPKGEILLRKSQERISSNNVQYRLAVHGRHPELLRNELYVRAVVH